MKKVMNNYSSKNDINIKQIIAYKDNNSNRDYHTFRPLYFTPPVEMTSMAHFMN